MKKLKIVSIEEVGELETIDIEVSDDHLFYCNGILTHNSGFVDSSDISLESIQGGISKAQSADNILGIVPDKKARENGYIIMKFLKTRDSGGVEKRVRFNVDWETLSFIPEISDENIMEINDKDNTEDNTENDNKNKEENKDKKLVSKLKKNLIKRGKGI